MHWDLAFFSLFSDELQLPRQPQRHFCLNPNIAPRGNGRRNSHASCKALHHDTCCWPQLLVRCAALLSDNFTCSRGPQKNVFIPICTQTNTITQHAKCKIPTFILRYNRSLCVYSSYSSFSLTPSLLYSLFMKYVFTHVGKQSQLTEPK